MKCKVLVGILAIILVIPSIHSTSAIAKVNNTNSKKIVQAVDPTIQYQTLEGWGTSLAWFANIIGGAPDKIRKEYADLLFSPKKGLGLNVVRYNIGGGENPKYDFMEPRAIIPGYMASPGKYDWSQDKNQRWMLQAAKTRGANIFEAFSNSPPYWMTNSGSVTGAKDGGNNLNPKYYDEFANYLTTVVEYFRNNWGITFRTLSPINEPLDHWWTFGNRQEGSHYSRSAQERIIKRVGRILEKKGLSTKISAPEEFSIDKTLSSWNSYDKEAKSYISQINTHTYGGSKRKALYNAAMSGSKRLWMSEYGDGDASGLSLSKEILKDMKQMKPAAWVYWQAVELNNGWGFLETDLNNPETDYSYTKTQKYYVMGNYSKFIRPGYKFIGIDNDNSLAAYDKRTNKLVIVSTNDTGSDRDVTYDLSKFVKVSGAVKAYQTSETKQLDKLPSIPLKGDQHFNTVLAPKSVTTFVIRNADYSSKNVKNINSSQTGIGANPFNSGH